MQSVKSLGQPVFHKLGQSSEMKPPTAQQPRHRRQRVVISGSLAWVANGVQPAFREVGTWLGRGGLALHSVAGPECYTTHSWLVSGHLSLITMPVRRPWRGRGFDWSLWPATLRPVAIRISAQAVGLMISICDSKPMAPVAANAAKAREWPTEPNSREDHQQPIKKADKMRGPQGSDLCGSKVQFKPRQGIQWSDPT